VFGAVDADPQGHHTGVLAEVHPVVRVRPHLQSGVRADVQRLRRVVTVVI
jgi:hypothetical protein